MPGVDDAIVQLMRVVIGQEFQAMGRMGQHEGSRCLEVSAASLPLG